MKFSSFSSYSVAHGNAKDFTGCLIGAEDSKRLAGQGFEIGAPIGATGAISTDGVVDIVLSHANPAGTVQSYDAADGSVQFNVAPGAIRLRSGNRVEELKREHDIHISKLMVQIRHGVVRLVSTDMSHFGKSKKRNALARAHQPSFSARVPLTQADAVMAGDVERPLVSSITKMGDNYALLMSPAILEHAGLSEGSRVEIEPVDDGQLVIRRSKRHFTLDELLAGMTPEREPPLEDDAPRGEETL